MFENMMKYEKAWKLFCEWIDKKYNYEFDREYFIIGYYYEKLSNDFILAVMPFFFDEYKIDIQSGYLSSEKIMSSLTSEYGFRPDSEMYFVKNKERIIVLKKACEKAFEILENQNG